MHILRSHPTLRIASRIATVNHLALDLPFQQVLIAIQIDVTCMAISHRKLYHHQMDGYHIQKIHMPLWYTYQVEVKMFVATNKQVFEIKESSMINY